MVQGVLFDLFETLVTESTAPVRRASSLAAALGVDDNAYRRQWRTDRRDVVLGRRSFRDTVARIARTLGAAPNEETLDHVCAERVEQKTAVLGAGIYQLACRQLAVPPSRALFIGDGADEELSGARTAGLPASRALWFLARWPHLTLPPDEPGLRYPLDMVQAAMAE